MNIKIEIDACGYLPAGNCLDNDKIHKDIDVFIIKIKIIEEDKIHQYILEFSRHMEKYENNNKVSKLIIFEQENIIKNGIIIKTIQVRKKELKMHFEVAIPYININIYTVYNKNTVPVEDIFHSESKKKKIIIDKEYILSIIDKIKKNELVKIKLK